MRDGEALGHLVAVMTAAGRHDATTALAGLDAAEATFGSGFHKSRADVDRARAAVAEADWVGVWRSAWAATTGLTWAFPPDPSMCPPTPTGVPFTDTALACGCGAEVGPGHRFCARCGAPAGS